MRSAVIIVENDHVALIERVRDGSTYYVFPGCITPICGTLLRLSPSS
jgi:hypothetical protein